MIIPAVLAEKTNRNQEGNDIWGGGGETEYIDKTTKVDKIVSNNLDKKPRSRKLFKPMLPTVSVTTNV